MPGALCTSFRRTQYGGRILGASVEGARGAGLDAPRRGCARCRARSPPPSPPSQLVTRKYIALRRELTVVSNGKLVRNVQPCCWVAWFGNKQSAFVRMFTVRVAAEADAC